MTREEKLRACVMFFNGLAEELSDTHEVISSCNNDSSAYLIPKGTVEELTYHSKPDNSYRVSDHWNWYANINKCENEKYIQCWSVDVPYPRKREQPGKSTRPRVAYQVSKIGEDGKYHVVFGEKWDRKKKEWSWVE